MTTLTCSVIVLLGGMAFAAEQPVKLEQLPPAVRQTALEQSKGATVHGYSKEVVHGKTLYEVETIMNGKSRDVDIDTNGKVVEVEQEITMDSMPAPARVALEKAAGSGKITKVESSTSGDKVSYEATIQKGHRRSEVQVDASGKRQKED